VAHDENSAGGEWPAGASAIDDGGEAVRESERRFRQEFGHAPFGMSVISLTSGRPSTYLAVNDIFCQLTGYSRRELAGGNFLGDVHPEEQPAIEAMIHKAMSGEDKDIRANTRMVCKDGEILGVRMTGTVIKPSSGDPYLSVYIEDTTAADQAQAELRRLEKEVQRLRRLDSLGQLADGIAHDFNNMLTVISNYASIVRDEVTVAEAAESAERWGPVRWDVEQIEDAADRAKRLIKHLLAFAWREQAHPAPLDLGQLINDTKGLLNEVLGEHVPVIIQGTAGLWPVEADRGLLEQAIINVVLNARDAMPGGGQITIEAANVDTASPGAGGPASAQAEPPELAEMLPGRYVQIRATDTGRGMDADTAARAFEPFFTTKPADQAAGLGLPAVRRIAAQAGGTAWLSSEPGKGTTVTIMLPATVSEPDAAYPGAISQPAGAILVIDDEAAIRDVVHRILTSAGYQVTTAASGPEALGVLANPATPIDVVLTDVVMPGMTGREFGSRAEALRPGIKLLFMSGYDRKGTAAESWPDPGTHVIPKPFSRAALLAGITRALAGREALT
jgi:two-component system, cell cycle sensor histidine kinase and response regulator CckA